MKTRHMIGVVPLVLIAATSFGQGDRAVSRGGGSSSGSSAGSRHTGGSSSGSSAGSASHSGGGSRSPAYQGSARSNSSSQDAAGRRPRPGTGTGYRDRYGNTSGGRYNSYPHSYYSYSPFAYSWGYRSYGLSGYRYGYNNYGYYPSSSYGSYRYGRGNIAQLRTLVEPAKTRVYVDGYYAGIADDFDGLLQRLNVSPGRHDITLKLDGYSSHTFSVFANLGQTIKLRWDMVQGSGETRDSIGDEYEGANDRDAGREGDEELDREAERERESAQASDRSRDVDSEGSDRRPIPPSRDLRDVARGAVLLEVEPLDASVYVDGEFYGKASQVNRIELAVGRHRIEVVRPGYKTEETEVEVTGEDKRVVVKLGRR